MVPTKRERQLMRVIHALWCELQRPHQDLEGLARNIRIAGLGWTIPGVVHLDDDDWLTPDQIAHELGYDVSTVRSWGSRYGLPRIRGKYRWGDIEKLLAPNT